MKPFYIPLDLQINILLGLPLKTLLRFRCVSKLWSSIITSRDFRNMHLNITAPPRLLIVFADFYGEKILVASTPNPNAPSHSSSSNKDLIIVKTEGKKVYNACQGLICIGAGFKDVGICNPSKNRQCSKKKRKSKKKASPYFSLFPIQIYSTKFSTPHVYVGVRSC